MSKTPEQQWVADVLAAPTPADTCGVVLADLWGALTLLAEMHDAEDESERNKAYEGTYKTLLRVETQLELLARCAQDLSRAAS